MLPLMLFLAVISIIITSLSVAMVYLDCTYICSHPGFSSFSPKKLFSFHFQPCVQKMYEQQLTLWPVVCVTQSRFITNFKGYLGDMLVYQSYENAAPCLYNTFFLCMFVCCGFHGAFLSSLCVQTESTWVVFLSRRQRSRSAPSRVDNL